MFEPYINSYKISILKLLGGHIFMPISEKVELLGKGLYSDIPDVLTIKSIPTASELDFVGSEDFEKTMLEVILPQAVEEDIDFKHLLEIDYQWICRCLRILNYGPFYTTNAIFCEDCGSTSYGEYQVNLETVKCKMLPDGFVNDIVIKKDEFLDFDQDIHIKLPTMQKMMNAEKDKAFKLANGKTNRELSRICYMISSIGNKKDLTPLEISMKIKNELSSADYIILKDRVQELADYGLRAGGSVQCPKCGSLDAAYVALMDDRFFRPTLGDLRKWKHYRSSREGKDVS